MSLGRKDFSETRTDGGADVFGLAGFFRDDDLIGHNRLVLKDRFDSDEMRTYHEQYRLGSCVRPPADHQQTTSRPPADHQPTNLGVGGSNPSGRAKFSYGIQELSEMA